MATGYPYTPLSRDRQETRLVCFDSRLTTVEDCFKRPLDCTIKIISTLTDDLPEYYAISYTWGDSKTRGSLSVDNMHVTIPENAETALRHLLAKQIEQRITPSPAVLTDSSVFAESPTVTESPDSSAWPSTEIRFWLDAICVDQHDLEEKSWQLLLISDIYSQAQEVCIWLGEDNDGMGEDIEENINSAVEQCKAETNDLADLFHTVWSLTPTDCRPSYSPAPLPQVCNVSVLRSLYASPWFQRLWILQESLLARNPKCHRGRHVVSFRNVALAARWLWYRTAGCLFPGDTRDSAHTTGIQNAATIWDMMSTPFLVLRVLSHLLLLGMRFNVTDPRDKVYAILGLLNDQDFAQLRPELLPDYSISLSELYTRFTRAVIRDTKSLYFMRIGSTLVPAAKRDQDAIELPSWVPRFDWTYEPSIGSPNAITARPRATSGGLEVRLRVWDGLPSVLTVQCLPVDEISHVAPESWASTKYGSDKLREQIGDTWTVTTERGSRNLCKDPLEIAFSFAICAGRNMYRMDLTQDGKYYTNCAGFFATCGQPCEQLSDYFAGLSENGTKPTSEDGIHVFYAMLQNTRNLVFFVTSNGRLGMVPKAALPGDRVCIIPGCDVPAILRREGAFWRYVGDAYIYGLMDDEYFQQIVRSGRLEAEMQWVNIH